MAGGRFFSWTPDDKAGVIIQVTDPATWQQLRAFYTRGNHNEPFEQLIRIAHEHEIKTVIVERRYIDLDYRSEHSHFYSTTFLRYPSVCHRLHFFASTVRGDQMEISSAQAAYRGYSIMRPLPMSPVGRTMVAPPRSLEGAVVCLAKDKVNLWGATLEIEAMPFISQDAQYLRCAHSSLWMMLYHAHLRFGEPRRLPQEIQQAASGGDVSGRQLPSDGLTPSQVLNALDKMNMSGGHIALPKTRKLSFHSKTKSLYGVLCRHINSDFPTMVHSRKHAWVVVGYKVRDGKERRAHNRITLFVHDDAKGPYLPVTDPWKEKDADRPGFWRSALPPLPHKVYMTAERAEEIATNHYRVLLRPNDDGTHEVPPDNLGRAIIDRGDLTLRTYAVLSTEFKRQSWSRHTELLARFYGFTHMPRWIWVVELHDRPSLKAQVPPTFGELVIDATASNLSKSDEQVVISAHIAGYAINVTPDYLRIRRLPMETKPFQLYESGSARSLKF